MKNTFKLCFAAVLLLTLVGLVIAQTSTPPNNSSEVSVDTGNGFGSSGTYVMRFANVDANVGTAIAYTSSSIDGDSFTINTDGVYSITYTDGAAVSPGDTIGISLNGGTSTSFASLSAGNRLCDQSMPYSYVASCSVTLLLNRNDVVRAHRTLATAGTATNSITRFIIVKVG